MNHDERKSINDQYLFRDMNINVKDRIKLIFDVHEFNIHEYLNGDNAFSFSSVQLNIPANKGFKILTNKDVIPFYAPIIAYNYMEEVVKLEEVNNRKIAYTKSFKVDLQKAIKENHITIYKHKETQEINKNNPYLKDFLTELIGNNESYALGLITVEERYNKIVHSFYEYYSRTFKEEIKRLEQEDLKLPDETFFRKTWEAHKPRKIQEERITRVNNINFIWPLSPNDKNWYTPIITKLLKMGLDTKLSTRLSFSGINLSKRKFGNMEKCHADLDIGFHSIDAGGENIFHIKFYEKGMGYSDFKTKDFWNDERFIGMLDKVLKSPVF